ncbi:ABC transporter substrate-binding protein [Variovorax sp. WS11]|uniref:Bug family tripartite tricarboxylate transporter substrate binding protein n=1 Tax=Variovorax sp. WS11 TaxID=1105204 RepID=UPI000D0D2B89|nr:tripartite tricarboxylate transporter substrate binding protein [Variovorax sp. WS11]NDZ18547.1 tripartite tricarboxylate transporter substrate binding protein [Variovorax sp. WS11]PSL85179.1 ABC transporter substrate-binding protein [Variovorax sp. WS11]
MTPGIDAPRRSLLATLLGLCALCACALPEFAHAQAAGFPSRPITIVVPYPPGGTTDVLARTLQEPMQRFLGQPVIVENKPGAAAVLGAKFVANAPGDGYTLLFPNNGLVISPQISKEANYDALKDFAPVSLVSLQPMILTTNPVVPATNVRELIAHAKANPGKLEYATAGPASFGHLATELFSQQAGIQMVHVPYKGQAPTTQAILTGESKVLLSTTSSQMNAFIKEGKVRMLGVASKKASPLAPGAAPIAETLPGFEAEVWFGLVAPKGTPAPVIAKLNDAVVKALALPEVQQKFEIAGAAATGSTPAEFARRIADEYGIWTAVIRDAKIEGK